MAFDGLRLTAENIDKRLGDHHVGDKVVADGISRSQAHAPEGKLAEPPEDTCYLVPDDDADDAFRAERESWLGVLRKR